MTTATVPTAPSGRRSPRRRLRHGALAALGTALLVLWLGACEPQAGDEVRVSVGNRTALVLGTDRADLMVFRLRPGDPDTIEVHVDLDGITDLTIDRSAIDNLAVNGYGGNDVLLVDGSGGQLADLEQTILVGGTGDDVLSGGSGADVLSGGGDDDLLIGNQGPDVLAGDDGDDQHVWRAGDGNDEVVGGAGVDRQAVHGNANVEAFGVAPGPGGRARVTRVVDGEGADLDLAEVETVEVRSDGGADELAVAPLTGTTLTSLEVDLSTVAGGGHDTVGDALVLGSPDVAIGHDGAAATIAGLGPAVRLVGGTTDDGIVIPGSPGSDVVAIDGTDGADQVSVQSAGSEVIVWGATPAPFLRLHAVEALDVDLADGTDLFSAVGNIAALTTLDVDGGPGADLLLGSNGVDVLKGGPGADHLEGRQAADELQGGAGGDSFAWYAGDGSDHVVGGGANDQFVLNGTSANENLGVEATAEGHVRLTRDIAAVQHDLVQVESLELRPVGGVDTVTVSDVAATDLTTVTTDMAATGGGDDGQQDSLVAPPGKVVRRDANGATVVEGLGAQVRIVNGSTDDRVRVLGTAAEDVVPVRGSGGDDQIALMAAGGDALVWPSPVGPHVSLAGVERLDVDALGGNDQVTSVGNLAALVSIDIDGGPGADTLFGSNGSDHIVGGPGADTIDGNQGNDRLEGGDHADLFPWDPGDGSDEMVGGAGVDRFVLNGSSAAEVYELVGLPDGHARFTRNLANIVHDLDDVEAVDVRALGGADVFNVGDLRTTDLTAVTGDLAGFGGVDDAAEDAVVVSASDAVVRRDGDAVRIDGVGPPVRVVGASANDQARVVGTGTADHVQVLGTPLADAVAVLSAGTDVVIQGATPGAHVRLAAIESTEVDLGEGPDQFSAVGNLAALTVLDVDAGGGDDTLIGGNGADRLVGGPGVDTIDGNQGDDVIDAGPGADVLRWDPGDGSDVVDGGTGIDRFVLDGSAASEVFALMPIGGGQVRLTRNIGNVVHDLAGIEHLDLTAREGSDHLTVGSLAGTALSEVVVDLASLPGGTADTVADQLVYNGTAGDDVLTVVDDGPDVVVQGGQPTLRVRGASPIDALLVQGLAGNDVINATAAAHALMALTLLP